jgi:flagellar basal body-associated protein FliL
MAEKEKPDKKSDGASGGEKSAPAKRGLLAKTPVLLGAVMVLEAAVLLAGFKLLGGGPQHAAGAELSTTEEGDGHGDGHGGNGDGHGGGKVGEKKAKSVELNVLDFKAPNKVNGRTFLYDVSIFVVCKSEYEKQVKDTLKEREALIKDRVRTIIAQSDPEKLVGGSEPGLETLRRQVKYQLDTIVGEGMIEEVLVPKCIPFRTDY